MKHKAIFLLLLLTSCYLPGTGLWETNYDKNPVVSGYYEGNIYTGYSKLLIKNNHDYIDTTAWSDGDSTISNGRIRIENGVIDFLEKKWLYKDFKKHKGWEKEEGDEQWRRTFVLFNGELCLVRGSHVSKSNRYKKITDEMK